MAHTSSPAELRARIEAERRGTPFVELRDAEGRQVIVDLDGDPPVRTIGRREGSDVVIDWDPQVSRLHAMLERAGDDWMVVDDGLSANGSFVNGERVDGRHRLHDGDRLCFGATAATLRRPSPDRARSTVIAHAGGPPPAVSEAQRKVLIALCRPLRDPNVATPATNREIAARARRQRRHGQGPPARPVRPLRGRRAAAGPEARAACRRRAAARGRQAARAVRSG